MRTATAQLIGEGARPAPWDLPLKLGRMGFSGWSPEAVEFFQDLRTDNTKACWSAHKDFYEASVREPMAELLDELSGEFGPGRIARPYRDMRFRADKSPYTTEIYATLDRGGYLRFGAEGQTAALGYHMMTAAQLERHRQAVIDDAHGARLAELTEGCGAMACRSVAGRCSRPRRAVTRATMPGSGFCAARA